MLATTSACRESFFGEALRSSAATALVDRRCCHAVSTRFAYLAARGVRLRAVRRRVGEVSVDQLEPGVRLALQSARRLALAAAAAEDPHTAAVLLYQSAEEVGKAKLLRDQFVAGKPLSGERLRDHVEKFRVAVDVIPPDCLELWGPAF